MRQSHACGDTHHVVYYGCRHLLRRFHTWSVCIAIQLHEPSGVWLLSLCEFSLSRRTILVSAMGWGQKWMEPAGGDRHPQIIFPFLRN